MSESELVVVFYREHQELRCLRGCCSEGSISDRFAIGTYDGASAAADAIAQWLDEYEHASQRIIVFRSWGDFAAYGRVWSSYMLNGLDGLTVFANDNPEFANYEPDGEDKAAELNSYLHDEVRRLLDDKNAERVEAERKQAETERARKETEARERDKKLYEELGKKLGVTT